MDARRLLRPLLALTGAFLALVLVAEMAVRVVADQLPPPTAGDTEEIVRKHDQLDALTAAGRQPEVVFFGNSTIDAGVDPQAFTDASSSFDSAFNAALLGNTLDVPQRWVDGFVLDQTDPQVVVLGVTPLDVLEGDRSEADAAIRAASFDVKFDEIEEGPAADLTRWANDTSYLVRYRSSLQEPATLAEAAWNQLTGQEPPGDLTRPDGFWEENVADDGAVLAYRQGQLQSPNAGVVDDLSRALPTDLRLDRVDDLIARADGTDSVLLIPPLALDALAGAGVPVERWHEIAGLIAQRGRELGMTTIDLSADPAAFPTAMFFDPVHLNAAGAEHLSTQLAVALDALCAQGAITCGSG
jgi:hypothetical protein